MKSGYKHQIQYQIYNRRNGNKDHGELALPHAAQNGTDGVVAIDEHHAAAADDGILLCVCPCSLRGIHNSKQLIAEQNPKNAKNHAGNELCGEQGTNGGLEIMILCADLLAEQNLCAKAEAHTNAQKHIEQLPADPNCGKAGRTDDLTHHHHIDHAIDGLQGVGKGDGNGENRQLPKHWPLGHILCNILVIHKYLLYLGVQ